MAAFYYSTIHTKLALTTVPFTIIGLAIGTYDLKQFFQTWKSKKLQILYLRPTWVLLQPVQDIETSAVNLSQLNEGLLLLLTSQLFSGRVSISIGFASGRNVVIFGCSSLSAAVPADGILLGF